MQHASVMLYCPNYTCQAPNPESHKFCQKCRTLLPRHYLWAMGDTATCRPGELLANRYFCKHPHIFLDTKPGLPPDPVELPESISAYLRLVPYQLHIPQVYDWVQPEGSADETAILLLNHAALYGVSDFVSRGIHLPDLNQAADATTVQLLPPLERQWQQATALRQLNWLWQIAHLWDPLSSEQVASSLLQPDLLRVEGPIVRLLELAFDQAYNNVAPPLAQLGQVWSRWVETAQPEVAPFLRQVCQRLVDGQVFNAEMLIAQLDEGLAQIGQAYPRHFQVATRTDRGPSRQRNEDACYPPDGATQAQTIHLDQRSAETANLVVVCDGIGGHQGGDIASHLAIEAVGQRVQSLPSETLDAATLIVELENAVCVANDWISQRNDSEQRYDRQRMGTTLVMGLVRSHELYVTHVGDSRVYWITRWGCYQVTLDDDVASREVRMGYASYRQALQHPSSGSLVQALGMGPSKTLHPTVQRFILDEDGVFLLCSDGLSDNDRVDESWETEILPLLDGKTDLSRVSQRLIEIGNTRNGYDNVTVGLVYYQVGEPTGLPTASPAELANRASRQPQTGRSLYPPTVPPDAVNSGATRPDPEDIVLPTENVAPEASLSTLKTQILKPKHQEQPSILPLLLGIAVLLAIAGALAYLLIPSVRNQVDPFIAGSTPSPEPTPAETATPVGAETVPLAVGDFIQVRGPATPNPGDSLLALRSRPEFEADSVDQAAPVTQALVSAGSVLRVLGKQGAAQQGRWVQVQVCSIPEEPTAAEERSPTPVEPNAPSPALADAGRTGWIEEAQLQPLSAPLANPLPAQLGACATTATPANPDPSVPPAPSP